MSSVLLSQHTCNSENFKKLIHLYIYNDTMTFVFLYSHTFICIVTRWDLEWLYLLRKYKQLKENAYRVLLLHLLTLSNQQIIITIQNYRSSMILPDTLFYLVIVHQSLCLFVHLTTTFVFYISSLHSLLNHYHDTLWSFHETSESSDTWFLIIHFLYSKRLYYFKNSKFSPLMVCSIIQSFLIFYPSVPP